METSYRKSDDPASLPHAIEAEQAVLGAILGNNDAFALTIDRLKPEHFSEPFHSRLYEAISLGISQGKLMTAVTLSPLFRNDPTLAEVGGITYLANLIAASATYLNARAYADIIIDTWVRRNTIILLRDLDNAIIPPSETRSIDSLRAALAAISDLAQTPAASTRRTLNKTVEAVVDRINEQMQGIAKPTGVKTGSNAMDQFIGGWRRQNFYVLGGRPSMGKTTVALSWLLKAAEQGAGVLYISLEMAGSELAERVLADASWHHRAKVPYKAISHGTLTAEEFERLLPVRQKVANLPFIIEERGSLTLEQIRAAAMSEKTRLASRGKRLDVIVVDHMGLVKPDERYRGNKVAETEEVSGGLKVLAKQLDCAVIALLQLSRAVESREDKRPSLSDLRWSGSIEQDADVVLFVYRDSYYLERTKKSDVAGEADRLASLAQTQHILEVITAKNRQGDCGSLEFYCDLPCGVVRDRDNFHVDFEL